MALFAIAGMVCAAVLHTANSGYIGISTGALILFGGGVSEMRGSIGGTTFSRNSSGAYARNRTKPVNPRTSKQSYVRSLFAYIAQLWRTLTKDQRNTWISYAPNLSRVNKLGQTVPLTGSQLFQKVNTNLRTTGNATLTTCESVSVPGIQLVDSVTNDIGANTMIVAAEDATVITGTTMRVFATAPRSAGSKFAGKSSYKLIHVGAGNSTLDTLDLYTEYVNTFGTAGAIGQVIGFKFNFIKNAVGIESADQTFQIESIA